MHLQIPPAVEEVIEKFDREAAPIDEHDVKKALIAARETLVESTEAEMLGAFAEELAFALDNDQYGSSPWGTYFRPFGAGTRRDGSTVYFPDIAGADSSVLAHWAHRARTVNHPVLRARYADLVWDMSRTIAKTKPDSDMARVAIDAYIASITRSLRRDEHEKFQAGLRALDLAVAIGDKARRDAARVALLTVHRESTAAGTGLWWIALDRLMEDKRVGLTDEERDALIANLESILARHSDQSDAGAFDPYVTQDAAERLSKYYRKRGQHDDARRVSEVLARTFEHFASLADPLLASALLQMVINAYRDAGMKDESQRTRAVMEKKIAESRGLMKPVTFRAQIPKEKVDELLDAVITDELGTTFARIALAFLPSCAEVEQEVAKELEETPFQAFVTQEIMADHHIAAKIGSVLDDPLGRLIHRAAQGMQLTERLLTMALDRAIEAHNATPGHFVGWAARTKLFEDLTLLMEGVMAWYRGDLVKAIHVLVPQIEVGLRRLVAVLGGPVTKPHPAVSGVSVVKAMGDILYDKEIVGALGEDLVLHFRALYADPRGINLRNDLAHGLLGVHRINLGLVSNVIHTLLVLGTWDELARVPRPRKAS